MVSEEIVEQHVVNTVATVGNGYTGGLRYTVGQQNVAVTLDSKASRDGDVNTQGSKFHFIAQSKSDGMFALGIHYKPRLIGREHHFGSIRREHHIGIGSAAVN